jgi:hypothetical protein
MPIRPYPIFERGSDLKWQVHQSPIEKQFQIVKMLCVLNDVFVYFLDAFLMLHQNLVCVCVIVCVCVC